MTDTDKITVTSGWKARPYVQQLKLFRNNSKTGQGPKNSTLWSEWLNDIYVVYSYNRKWPIYANWKGIWFRNEDKYSPTTSKHQSQTHPLTLYVPVSRIDLEYTVLFGEPSPELLVNIARLGLLPDELLAKAAEIRLTGETLKGMTVGEVYNELRKGA